MNAQVLEFDSEAEALLHQFEHPGAKLLKPRGRTGKYKLRLPDALVAVAATAGAAAVDEYKAAERRDAEAARVERKAALGGFEKLSDVLAVRTFTQWLERDVLERGVIAIAVGPRGSYKTAWANDLAMRVALRGEPVLVITAEGPQGFQRRALAWLHEFDGGLTDPASIPLYVRRRRVNLSATEQIEVVASWRAEIEKQTGKPVALIVVDTLRKNSAHKENDNDETSALIGAIDTHLRHHETSPTTVLCLHHTGHSDQTRGRGASSLAADTDAEYVISFKAGVVAVTRERFKDSPSLPPLYYTPKVRTLDYQDPDGKPVTSIVLMPSGAPAKPKQDLRDGQRQLLAHVTKLYETDGKPLSIDRANDGLCIAPSQLKRQLAALARRGLVFCSAEGLYSIPDPVVCDDSGTDF